jgi:hypothetical protein
LGLLRNDAGCEWLLAERVLILTRQSGAGKKKTENLEKNGDFQTDARDRIS